MMLANDTPHHIETFNSSPSYINNSNNVFTLVIQPNTMTYTTNATVLISSSSSSPTALEDQQRLTKDLEERRAKAEQDRILLERERIEAEKKASQIADIANEEKEKMVKKSLLFFLTPNFLLRERCRVVSFFFHLQTCFKLILKINKLI